MVQPSKVELYLKVNAWKVGDNKIWYHNAAKAWHTEYINAMYTGHIEATVTVFEL